MYLKVGKTRSQSIFRVNGQGKIVHKIDFNQITPST